MTAQPDIPPAAGDRPRTRSREQVGDAEAEWIRAQVARAPALRAEQRQVIYRALHARGGDAA